MSHTALVFVLAAGLGTRMQSKTCKVLHPVAGKPMLNHVLETCAMFGATPIVVLSPDSEPARSVVPTAATIAIQDPPLGTGDAVRVALDAVTQEVGAVVIIYGDTPLLRPETLESLSGLLQSSGAAIALLTANIGTVNTYGRIVRERSGNVTGIVEYRLATDEQRAISECNLGAYAMDLAWLRASISKLKPNETGEIFLTDLVEIALANGRSVVAHRSDDPAEGLGVNTRVDLALVDAIARQRIREAHMMAGVTFNDPDSSLVDSGVRIASDVVIERGCVLQGNTVIGGDSVIGPYSIVRDSAIGERCRVEASVIEGATLENDVRIGPFSHLRPGAHLESGVELGNFGEVKNARLRARAKMHHFGYIGDADVGERVNIGAGTITLNYDGQKKHRTEIGNDAFIGSDTLLRAPVKVGEGAVTGAGAVVTKDVPPGMLAVGMPARSIKKVERRIKD